ncbi:MAG: methylenetetrahydrofolate reductase [Bacteroidaceae bacterium]|nr:methylenetetrahydrofolate reductase [NAD(P)H] [Bacteroidaceae bacterium]MBR1754971.1 methylenetetrahydrofolate reductase [NAD(P)H] [Bacteroidaceae bacterium]
MISQLYPPATTPAASASGAHPGFSFEVLPPLKGNGTETLFRTIETLAPFAPRHINITTHRAEYVYREVEGGLVERSRVRRRPGTIAIAAAIQQRWGIPVIPHLVCSGSTKQDIEYALLDLQFLGISDVFLLRGDKAKEEAMYQPTPGGYTHALELIDQVNRFNDGFFADGTPIKVKGTPFEFGVAAYPEKHEEAPNLESDIQVLLEKQRRGAKVAITQLFYDNERFFAFLDRARAAGITIPIIPGLKPLTKLSQISVVPKTFRCDLPQPLYAELRRCQTDDAVKQVGIEWAVAQCRDLLAHGIPSLHFYTLSAVDSIRQIATQIY